MSIIIPLIYSSKGVQVQRATVPVGYELPSYDVFVEKMIGEVLIHIRLLHHKLPKFDKVVSIAPGYPPIELSGDVFFAAMNFAQLLREGAARETVVKMAKDHLDALGQIDASTYSDDELKELKDALLVTTIFIQETERG